MSDNTGGPAFPFPSDADAGEPGELGMTLRDYFAAKAMSEITWGNGYDYAAEQAYLMADAMLKERMK